MVLALFGALASFIAVATLFAWLGGTFRNPVEARLTGLAPAGPRVSLEAPFADRVFIPVVDGVVRTAVSLLPRSYVARVNRQLLSAGSPMSAQAFFTLVLLSGLLLPAGMAFLIIDLFGVGSALAVLLIIFFSPLGLLLPFIWLRRRVRLRKTAIWKRLSDAFDLVTVCVEAGLGLDAALKQVASKLRGPLGDEIALMLRQVGMGRPRREALEDMAVRVDVQEVSTFVNSVIQAEQLGTSLGRVLRAQSMSLRAHRRQKAEENARRAPIKMVFPLVLFIMPTFFIVTIGPVFVHLLDIVQG